MLFVLCVCNTEDTDLRLARSRTYEEGEVKRHMQGYKKGTWTRSGGETLRTGRGAR